MTDTLTRAYGRAAAGLDGVALSLLEARLHQLQVDLATDHWTGARPVRVPGAAPRWTTPPTAPSADAPLTPEETRALLGATRVGRRVLAEQDQRDPPPIDPGIRAALAQTDLGRSVLRSPIRGHQDSRPTERGPAPVGWPEDSERSLGSLGLGGAVGGAPVHAERRNLTLPTK